MASDKRPATSDRPAPAKRRKPLPARGSRSSRDKVRAHRARLRKGGLRLVQMWMPDTRSAVFAKQAHRDSLVIAGSEHEADDQAWIDAVSWWNSPEARALEEREASADHRRRRVRKRK